MKSQVFYRIFIASSTSLMIAGPVIVFVIVGVWLDGLFDTSPYMALGGGIIGFIGSILTLLKVLKNTK